MSDDLKKHIQLIESQLNENPLSSAIRAAAGLGQGSKKTARIMPDPEDDIIPSSRALTPATELPPSIDAEIAQRITVLKTINNIKDRQQILTQLDQAEGLLRAIDKLPEDMVRDALKHAGIRINDVRMLAKRMTRIKAQVEEAKTMNRRVWREAVKDATQIKDAAQKAAKATDVEAVSVVIRNTVAIAAAAGLMGFVAAAALEQRGDMNESQLDEGIFTFIRRLMGFGYTKAEADRIAKTAAYLERSGVKGSNIEQLMRNADQYDPEEMIAQLRQLSADDIPDDHALKVNRDTVDPDAVPDEKSLTRDPVNVGNYSRFDPEDLNPYTGKPLTKAEQRLQSIAGATVIFAAGVNGIVLGITGANFLLALQKPKDHDLESVKRMRAYIKDGFKAQAGWLKDLTGDQINALKDFARTGKYQHIDEEELEQRMEALRARLEQE